MTTTRVRHRHRAAVLLAACALLLVGCGDGSADSDASGQSSDAAAVNPDESLVTGDGASDAAPGVTEPLLPQESVFSVLSPWNTTASDRPVHRLSEALLHNSKIRIGRNSDGTPARQVVEDGVVINTRAWTVPIVADGEPTTIHCRQVRCGDGVEDLTLDIPVDIDPDPRYDGWYTVFDPDEQRAYDLWRARRESDGTISYQFMQQWDLAGPGFNQPYVVGARGSGLPLFGGLIRSGELERGEINHALAISIPGAASGSFIQPASATDGDGLAYSLPEGARIFVKPDFRLTRPVDPVTGKPLAMTSKQYTYARYLIEALKTYGAIVVDRSIVPTLYFERLEDEDTRPPIAGYELQSLGLEDFNVVDFDRADRITYPSEDELIDSSDLEGQGGVLQGGAK